MQVHLAGRLRKFKLPFKHGLVPVYEAIVNSIHSVLSTSDGSGQVEVIVRRPVPLPGVEPADRVTGFDITDDGIGFTAENFASFKMVDSVHKLEEYGGQGVGRLSWLKAFEYAEIDSVFFDGDKKCKRSFTFSSEREVAGGNVTEAPAETEVKTRVRLVNFKTEYGEACPKSLADIAARILGHLIPYLAYKGDSIAVSVRDDVTGEVVSLNELFNAERGADVTTYRITANDCSFEVLGCRVKPNNMDAGRLVLCAHRLPVKRVKLAKYINNVNNLSDDESRFGYAAYVSSDILDNSVNQERSDFRIMEGLFAETELGYEEIIETVAERVGNELSTYTQAAADDKFRVIQSHVEERAKEYRLLLTHRREQLDAIPMTVARDPKRLEIALLRAKHQWKLDVRGMGDRLLEDREAIDTDEYREVYSHFVGDLNALGLVDLAEYVAHRKTVIELLRVLLQKNEDGRFRYENELHRLFFPMRRTSGDVAYEKQNLWLIDERLAYHQFLSSDKTIKSTEGLESDSTLEPDIFVAFREGGAADAGNPIALVEFKRPGPKFTDPFPQLAKYIEKIRDSEAQTIPGGRPIRVTNDTPFYCYIVADLTKDLIRSAKLAQLMPSYDQLSWYGYNAQYKAYYELLSYDKVLQLAEMRNRTFFEKLNLPDL